MGYCFDKAEKGELVVAFVAKAIATPQAAAQDIGHWVDYYNSERPHSSLDGYTPEEIYAGLALPLAA